VHQRPGYSFDQIKGGQAYQIVQKAQIDELLQLIEHDSNEASKAIEKHIKSALIEMETKDLIPKDYLSNGYTPYF
jgi:hypothetical protein